ncbi:MAG: biotin synthase BioB [Bacteroidota bacterium]
MEDTPRKWTLNELVRLYKSPLLELVYRAAGVHRKHHDPRKVQVSTLLSIKTGGCPEDCAYCPQAARYHTNIETNDLMSVEEVKKAAINAQAHGSSRLCMGAAWRNVRDGDDFDHVLKLVQTVNGMNMEVCCTLGMLSESQAKKLAQAGLYAYNHNLDSSDEFYKEIISTRGYDDRLQTLENARKAKLTLCSGGIIGMGEKVEDRCKMLLTLFNMNPVPESVPINALVAVEGTPMEDQEPVPIWDMIRMVATTRIVLPQSTVRLSAGRTEMTREGQALCFLAGAGSIFSGNKLLTTPNPCKNEDMEMFEQLGLIPQEAFAKGRNAPVEEEEIVKQSDERVKWSRPAHRIEKNIAYTEAGKAKRRAERAKKD